MLEIDPLKLPTAFASRAFVIFCFCLYLIFMYGIKLGSLLFMPNENDFYKGSVLLALTCVLLFIVISYLNYRFHPIRRRRSFGRAVELVDGKLLEHVLKLAKKKNVPNLRIWTAGSVDNFNALAFGLKRRPEILIARGLQLLFVRDRSAFDARMLHEIGHILNSDSRSCFIVISFINTLLLFTLIFLIAALFLPPLKVPSPDLSGFGVLLAFANRLADVMLILVGPLFAVAIVAMEFKALLRSRELLADYRAKQEVGSSALARTFEHGQERGLRFFSNHPSIKHRISGAKDSAAYSRGHFGAFLWHGFVAGALTRMLIELSWVAQQYSPVTQFVDYRSMLEWAAENFFEMNSIIILLIFTSVIQFTMVVSLVFDAFRVNAVRISRDSVANHLSRCISDALFFTTGGGVGYLASKFFRGIISGPASIESAYLGIDLQYGIFLFTCIATVIVVLNILLLFTISSSRIKARGFFYLAFSIAMTFLFNGLVQFLYVFMTLDAPAKERSEILIITGVIAACPLAVLIVLTVICLSPSFNHNTNFSWMKSPATK